MTAYYQVVDEVGLSTSWGCQRLVLVLVWWALNPLTGMTWCLQVTQVLLP